MIVPGSNLLALAQTMIAPQGVSWRRFTGIATNAAGRDVPEYADGVMVWGSFQPVSLDRVSTLGLDTAKSWATFYATGAYKPVTPDGAPDQFDYGGRRYEVKDKVDWFAQDGWNAVLVVDIGATADA